jgi:hypothetical protein
MVQMKISQIPAMAIGWNHRIGALVGRRMAQAA